jgi:hypothetical protein
MQTFLRRAHDAAAAAIVAIGQRIDARAVAQRLTGRELRGTPIGATSTGSASVERVVQDVDRGGLL